MTNSAITDLSVRFDKETGQNLLIFTTTDGEVTKHVLNIAPMDLIEKLDTLSVGVEVSDEQYRQLHIDTFTAIVESIASLDTDPQAPRPFGWFETEEGMAPATAAQIAAAMGAITIDVTDYDNGWFPSAMLTNENIGTDTDKPRIIINDRAYIAVPILEGSDLYPALRELFGNYRYESDWRVTLYRDPAPEAVRSRDDR